jgi:hypothetical protein
MDRSLRNGPNGARLESAVQAYFDERVGPHVKDLVRGCAASLSREGYAGPPEWRFSVVPTPLFGSARPLPQHLFDGLLPVLEDLVGGEVRYVPGVEA